MKKNIYTLFVSLCVATGMSAQAIVVAPDSVYMTVASDVFEVVGHAEWINTSDIAVTYQWTRQVQCKPTEWQSLICDENACYLPATHTNDITLEPGDTSKMDVHIRPNGVNGTAIVFVELYDIANPSNVVVTKFYYNTTTCTTGTNDVAIAQAQLSPNPAATQFSIEEQPIEVKNVAIYSLQGQLIKSFAANSSARYDVADVAVGAYVVRTSGNDGSTLSVSRLMILR